MSSPCKIIPQKSFFTALVALLIAFSGTAGAEETISYPSRHSDLPDDTYWNMSGDHGGSNSRDMNVARRSGGGWTHLDSNGGPENTDTLIFGVPLYAPADGEVVSCWRRHPDNPRPGTPHTGRCCGNNCEMSCDDGNCPSTNACTIARSGNHIAIQKKDGDVVLLAHLKANSVPASVCPFSNQFMSNARNRLGDFPAESYLRLCQQGESPSTDDCVSSRPKVKQGEFIGRAGNSGASSGPHLHFHTAAMSEANGILTKVGVTKPTNINYGWLKHRTDNSVWKPFSADPVRNSPVLVVASPYLRRADASAGDIKRSDVLFVSGNRAVTATVGQSNNNLKLIGWDLVGVSSINRKGQIEAGAVKDVALSEPASGYVLAAVRQADNLLKMIAYQVTPTGGFRRVATRSAGTISGLAMATVPGGGRKAVTAVRDEDGNLKLIVWDISVSSGGNVSIERLGQASAGKVSALSISRARNFNGVFTAVRDSAGKLKVISWQVSVSGQSVTRRDSASAGSVGMDISVAPLAQGVAAAVRDAEDKLRLVTWSVSSNGQIGNRRGTGIAGKITAVRVLTSPHGGSNLTTVVRDASGDLLLIGWKVDGNGTHVRRLGSSRAGAVSEIAADVHSRSYPGTGPRDMVLTSVRDGTGNLKLISWDVNLVNP